ncbi:lmo0937 family membrane protein [Aquibacillus rhizosphaerae]|uniref:Lmo0937 family membrane protein n=1 Tax=Aquibacillus rhizosphaerae TaxID=3051431 RepID=A0ABT7L3E5_9BACI|nr:lmo0937 family membrane protein [Aquibacillus sp. LR5S19]MDL4840387.1 lmo0937 family membrane protein [Aquibacillus sp. LR5S19]
MFWTIIGLILLFWFAGLLLDLAGGLIHILLVVALVVFIVKLIKKV